MSKRIRGAPITKFHPFQIYSSARKIPFRVCSCIHVYDAPVVTPKVPAYRGHERILLIA